MRQFRTGFDIFSLSHFNYFFFFFLVLDWIKYRLRKRVQQTGQLQQFLLQEGGTCWPAGWLPSIWIIHYPTQSSACSSVLQQTINSSMSSEIIFIFMFGTMLHSQVAQKWPQIYHLFSTYSTLYSSEVLKSVSFLIHPKVLNRVKLRKWNISVHSFCTSCPPALEYRQHIGIGCMQDESCSDISIFISCKLQDSLNQSLQNANQYRSKLCYWFQYLNFDRYWSALIGIGQWSRESWN